MFLLIWGLLNFRTTKGTKLCPVCTYTNETDVRVTASIFDVLG